MVVPSGSPRDVLLIVHNALDHPSLALSFYGTYIQGSVSFSLLIIFASSSLQDCAPYQLCLSLAYWLPPSLAVFPYLLLSIDLSIVFCLFLVTVARSYSFLCLLHVESGSLLVGRRYEG